MVGRFSPPFEAIYSVSGYFVIFLAELHSCSVTPVMVVFVDDLNFNNCTNVLSLKHYWNASFMTQQSIRYRSIAKLEYHCTIKTLNVTKYEKLGSFSI